MALFNVIEDAFVILRARGVFKQAKVFARKGRLYAGHGSGFIGITRSGTTVPNVSVDELALGFEPVTDDLGRLYQTRKDIPQGK